jgi:hypothetical protein
VAAPIQEKGRGHQVFPTSGPLSGHLNLDLRDLTQRIAEFDSDLYCYVLTSVKSHDGRFEQTGSSPNYQGGLISLPYPPANGGCAPPEIWGHRRLHRLHRSRLHSQATHLPGRCRPSIRQTVPRPTTDPDLPPLSKPASAAAFRWSRVQAPHGYLPPCQHAVVDSRLIPGVFPANDYALADQERFE